MHTRFMPFWTPSPRYTWSQVVRVLGYCCNGFGHGHLSRMTALLAALRNELESQDAKIGALDLMLLTESERAWPTGILQIPIIKLPSKRFVTENEGGFSGEAKQLLAAASRSVVQSHRPDIFIIDTCLAGAFDEFADGELFRSFYTVFINRERKRTLGLLPSESGLIDLMRHVVVPHTWKESPNVPSGQAPMDWVGPIIVSDCIKPFSRPRARSALGLAPAEQALVVYPGTALTPRESTRAAALFDALHAAAPEARLFCLDSDKEFVGTERLVHFPAAELLAAFDGALCCGSYNLTHELLHAGIPAALYERHRHIDDQGARIARFTEAGACLALQPEIDTNLRGQLLPLFDAQVCRGLSQAARAAVPGGGTQRAARRILERWQHGL